MTSNIDTPAPDLMRLLRDLKSRAEHGADAQTMRPVVDQAIASAAAGVGSHRKGEFAAPSSLPFDAATAPLPAVLQEQADGLYLASKLLRRDPRTLKGWLPFERRVSGLRKALDTATAGEGAEWVPTGFSQQLVEKVRQRLKVAALHRRISMPTNPFKLPVEGADAVAYLFAESTSDTGTKITASTPGTTNVTFNAVKLAARVLVSAELEEDSVIAVMPYLLDTIVRALADAQEDAAINGDDSGTHQDSDVTASTDARKAWKGYRKHALAGATVDVSTFDVVTLRSIRVAMARYGINPNDLAWIAGFRAFHKLLGLAEVQTVDQYGDQATLLSGELAKFDGIPIIVSEFVREDLNATGVYDGVTTDRSVLPLVYTPAFLYGDRRAVNVRVSHDLYMESDQDVAIATQRLDFQPVYDATTEPIVGLGVNLTA